jgi:predicted double-glycine peptidase
MLLRTVMQNKKHFFRCTALSFGFVSLLFYGAHIYAQTDAGIHANPHLITKSLYQITNIIRVPLTRQATSYTCGVAALQSVLSYYGDDYNERDLEKELRSDPKEGTSYQSMLTFAREHGYSAAAYFNMNLKQLEQNVSNDKPTIVAIQAWRDNEKIAWKNAWDDGHYVVAIGYDKENIYFMDPSILGYYAFIPKKEFLIRWHDQENNKKLLHLGIVITKDKPLYDPSKLAYIE